MGRKTVSGMKEARPAQDLPMLQQVFYELRHGRHICSSDGGIYIALKNNFDAFRDLFEGLGFRLEAHPKDFYYFKGTGSLSDRAERMAVFMFVLIEWLADQGETVEEALMSKGFSVDKLPHLSVGRYQEYMKEAGIVDEEGIIDVLKAMERYGFVERTGNRSFSFKAPVFRFVDLCYMVLDEHGSPDDSDDTDDSDDSDDRGGRGDRENKEA